MIKCLMLCVSPASYLTGGKAGAVAPVSTGRERCSSTGSRNEAGQCSLRHFPGTSQPDFQGSTSPSGTLFSSYRRSAEAHLGQFRIGLQLDDVRLVLWNKSTSERPALSSKAASVSSRKRSGLPWSKMLDPDIFVYRGALPGTDYCREEVRVWVASKSAA